MGKRMLSVLQILYEFNDYEDTESDDKEGLRTLAIIVYAKGLFFFNYGDPVIEKREGSFSSGKIFRYTVEIQQNVLASTLKGQLVNTTTHQDSEAMKKANSLYKTYWYAIRVLLTRGFIKQVWGYGGRGERYKIAQKGIDYMKGAKDN